MPKSPVCLSTPSARRATQGISPNLALTFIYTHALREEGDFIRALDAMRAEKFLPTPSARRATRRGRFTFLNKNISTHALREEGDWATKCKT